MRKDVGCDPRSAPSRHSGLRRSSKATWSPHLTSLQSLSPRLFSTPRKAEPSLLQPSLKSCLSAVWRLASPTQRPEKKKLSSLKVSGTVFQGWRRWEDVWTLTRRSIPFTGSSLGERMGPVQLHLSSKPLALSTLNLSDLVYPSGNWVIGPSL
jgi:hypothetical protein